MSRPAIASPDQIRSTILSMLAEAHDSSPPTRERFRRIVSVRKLKDRLGGGDPATLGRTINAIESEIISAGLADMALPDIPADISDLMRQLWQAAVSSQLDDVVKLKLEAQQSVETAQETVAEANMRVDMLREELDAIRALLSMRDQEVAQARAELVAAHASVASMQLDLKSTQAALHESREQSAAAAQIHQESLVAAQQRYEGLSKQLLQETALQRQQFQQEQSRLSSQLKFAERRISTLEEAISHAEADAASERDKRQAAVGEATALKAVNASQRSQLEEIMRSTLANAATTRHRRSPAPAEPPGSKQPAPRRKGG